MTALTGEHSLGTTPRDPQLRRDAMLAIALAVAILAVFALPVLFLSDAASQRERSDAAANHLREIGLTLLEKERPLQNAMRALRTDAIQRGAVAPARRSEVERMAADLAGAVNASALASALRIKLASVLAAWSNVRDIHPSISSIDRVVSAEHDLADTIGNRAAFFTDRSSIAPDGARLYLTNLAAIADRIDRQQNLTLATGNAAHVPQKQIDAIRILAAQEQPDFDAALDAAEQFHQQYPQMTDLEGPIRALDAARARFHDAVTDALTRRERPVRGFELVDERAADVDGAIDRASASIFDMIRGDLATQLADERDGETRIWWTAASAWIVGLALVAAGWISQRERTRVAQQRERARGAAALAVTEAQLDAIFERSTIGVAILDAAGTLTRANNALAGLIERLDASAIGASDDRFAALVAGKIDTFSTQMSAAHDRRPRKLQSDFSVLRNGSAAGDVVLAFVRDTTAQTSLEDLLRFEATHDPLTILPNRAFLGEHMRSLLGSDVPQYGLRAIAYLEIDSDSSGYGNKYAVGDETIVAIASRLTQSVEDGAFVARFDGNAFVVLLQNLDRADAAREMIGRILERLAGAIVIGGREFHFNARAGVAILDRPYTDPLDAVRDAELAMHEAHGADRSAVAIFSPDMRERATRRAAIATALRRAIDREQLYLHYQPVVSAKDRYVHGFEALLRWDHPELGSIAPLDFIPIAEQTGLIVPIGRWVVERACEQLAAWRADGIDTSGLSMAINASVHEIVAPDYARFVGSVIRRFSLWPGQIVIEVTESAILESGRYAAGSLERLKELGVGLAIDDFGTGYSSMRYLMEFPFGQLKIDGSFVRGPGGTLASEAIVTSLVALAASAEMTTVAEGVETEAQAAQLVALGVQSLQGYLFGRPMPPSAIFEKLSRQRNANGPARLPDLA